MPEGDMGQIKKHFHNTICSGLGSIKPTFKQLFLLIGLCGLYFPSFAFADVTLGNSIIIEEDTGFGNGMYIPPNEEDFQSFGPALKGRTGVLVSVGTFRALHDAAFGDFSKIILFDYDQTNNEFSRENLKLIQHSSDRYEYLAMLLNRKVSENLFRKVREHKMSDLEFLRALEDSEYRDDWQSFSYLKGVQNILTDGRGVVLYPMCFEKDPRIKIKCSKGSGTLHHYLTTKLENALESAITYPDRWKNTIWGSDTAFKKIKKLAKKGNILVVSGDLTGYVAMKSLALALEQEGLRVSALDLSNVIDYIGNNQQFYENIKQLPYTLGALVLVTRCGTSIVPSQIRWDDFWGYCALPVEKFVEITSAVNPKMTLQRMVQGALNALDGDDVLRGSGGWTPPSFQ